MGRGTRLGILSVLCCLFAFVVSGTGCKTVEDATYATEKMIASKYGSGTLAARSRELRSKGIRLRSASWESVI